jgi:hypothetical protein
MASGYAIAVVTFLVLKDDAQRAVRAGLGIMEALGQLNTGDRTALGRTRPFCAPHHTISNVGLIGGAMCRCRVKCHWPTTAYSSWMDCPSFAVMCSRSCASHSRIVSCRHNLSGVLGRAALTALAVRMISYPSG